MKVERIWKSLDVPTVYLQAHARRNTPSYHPSNVSRPEQGKRQEIKGSWLWLQEQREPRAAIEVEII